MRINKIDNYKIILASKSPRRQALLKELFSMNENISIEIKTKEIVENYPKNLKGEEIALFLSKQKADGFSYDEIGENTILITADTIVYLDNLVLNKPKDFDDAFETLKLLSGKKHEVITAVFLKSREKLKSFAVTTNVFFKELSDEEITFYVKHYKPYDKAGAYGIQEWIGYIGIEKIEGSFYNVMGLPVQALYEELNMF
ncbi:MAG: septum formation protein Maf [Bacteroidales bacterium]|nr:septum formation protein Maf [Bacteroidales bacterium]